MVLQPREICVPEFPVLFSANCDMEDWRIGGLEDWRNCGIPWPEMPVIDSLRKFHMDLRDIRR